jgi:dTDP-4-dehydrorhamnose reductase
MNAQTPRPLAVLGGSGFLGAHVVLRALARGEQRIVSISREPRAFPQVRDPRLEFAEVEALEDDALERVLDELQPMRVILCTALTSIDECEKNFELAVRLNTAFAGRVALWCAGAQARLVFASTDLVFGREAPEHGSAYREDDYPAPCNLYGVTKMAGETAVFEAGGQAAVARLPLLYGDSLGRARGASDSLLRAIERGERPTLFTDEFRTPLDVVDAADALLELAGHTFAGTLHVGGPERVQRHELGLALLRAHGFSHADARAAVRAGVRADLGVEVTRPSDVSLDSGLALRTLRTSLHGVHEITISRRHGT